MSRPHILSLLLLILFLTFPLLAQEESLKTKAEIQALIEAREENTGVIQGAERKAYKKQFPLCNEFLKIHWFPKREGKRVRGWRYYDFYIPPTLYSPPNDNDFYALAQGGPYKKGSGYEIVEIQEDGQIRYYGLYFLMRAFPKEWKEVAQEMEINNRNASGDVADFTYKTKAYGASKAGFPMSVSGYKNFCAITPDEERAVFYQTNRAGIVLTQEEQEAISAKIRASGVEKEGGLSLFGHTVMDINHDGQPDLIGYGVRESREALLFSYKGGYQAILYTSVANAENSHIFDEVRQEAVLHGNRKKEVYGLEILVSSPSVTDYTCYDTSDPFSFSSQSFSTDGQNFIVRAGYNEGTICNLTKLTTPKGE